MASNKCTTVLQNCRKAIFAETPGSIISRRAVLAGAGAIFALQTARTRAEDLPSRIDPPAADPTPAALAKAATPYDLALGAAKAPVTLIAYASLTSPLCAQFATAQLPEIKRRYIDAGRLRFILREFPLDPMALAGFLGARCAGPDKSLAAIEALFAKQDDWAKPPAASLKAILKSYGVGDKAFNQCLADTKATAALEAARQRAERTLGIHAVPAFFVNGKRLTGDHGMAQLLPAIEAALPR